MLNHYENIKGIKGYVNLREKQIFYARQSKSIIIYKGYMQGLVGISLQTPDVTVEDNGSYWVVRRKG